MRKSKIQNLKSEVVLLAVMGMSPAVLTETVWALAKPQTSTIEPIIPDKVIVLTTSRGASCLRQELFGPEEVWQALRKAVLGKRHRTDARLSFGPTGDCVRVFTRNRAGRHVELEDVSSLEENAAVADCITDVLWGLVEKPGTQLVVSISGGFKTMSALLFAGMSLLGRPHDRITHVLVNKPFDTLLQPKFYFPHQPSQDLKDAQGKVWEARHAAIRLGDVPFVALHALLGKYQKPHSYSELVSACQGHLDKAVSLPEIRYEEAKQQVWVGEQCVSLCGREQPLYAFLHDRALRREPSFPDHYAPVQPFVEFLESWAARHPEYSFKDRSSGLDWRKDLDNTIFRGPFSSLRNKLSAVGGAKLFPAKKGHLGLVLSATSPQKKA